MKMPPVLMLLHFQLEGMELDGALETGALICPDGACGAGRPF